MAKQTQLRELFGSLDARWRPEDVATRILKIQDIRGDGRSILLDATGGRRRCSHTSMREDFARVVDMKRSLDVAEALGLGSKPRFRADDLNKITTWLKKANASIGKTAGRSDFKADRLNKEQRRAAGLGDMSRRQYNKRFRLLARMEKKLNSRQRESFKRALTLASKTRLGSKITWNEFRKDVPTACFIAYYVARCNRRSVFTNTSQSRAYDEVCEMLMTRLRRRNTSTNWLAIAYVLPSQEVLKHLTQRQKGRLVGKYFDLMHDASSLLFELHTNNDINEQTMIVKSGNDSSTWNLAAGAFNKLRQGWFALMYDLGMVDAVERMCPGKVLRLIAADVAYWHRASGGDLHDDTLVWRALPYPWDVLSGDADCPKGLVDAVCGKYGFDPTKSGWSAPNPGKRVEKTEPTPELVHGVAVASPALATLFRKAGVFSGKKIKGEVPPVSLVDEARQTHAEDQEVQRAANMTT